jgi:hypothetical protein
MKGLVAGLVAGFVGCATTAAGQGISLNRPGSGARAAGMGNAFIAVSDDGTAASWNPAGLSQLRRPELSVVFSASRRDQRFEGLRTLDRTALFTSLGSATTTGNLEFASGALPLGVLGKSVTIQAGWRRLFELGGGIEGDVTRVPISATSRPASVIHLDNASDGHIDLVTLAAAIRLTSRISVGIGTDFYHGRWSDRVSAVETPGFVDSIDSARTGGTNAVGGHAFNLGVLLAYPSVRVGVVYHGPLTTAFEITRTLHSNLVPPIDNRFGRDAGLTLRLPRSIGAGVAWLPRPLLRLALDATYDRWTEFLINGPPDSPVRRQSGFDGLSPELSATRNTVTLNAGMERLFPIEGRFVPLRLGVSLEPQGARDPFVRADAHHTVLAAGTGLNSNNVKLDVALEYRWGRFDQTMALTPVYQVGRAEELGLALPPEAQGSVRFREVRLKVSMIYRITRSERSGSASSK